MMGDIINLRQARKAKKRVESESRAAANRVKHGRSKGEKRLVDMTRQKHDAVIDHAFRDRVED